MHTQGIDNPTDFRNKKDTFLFTSTDRCPDIIIFLHRPMYILCWSPPIFIAPHYARKSRNIFRGCQLKLKFNNSYEQPNQSYSECARLILCFSQSHFLDTICNYCFPTFFSLHRISRYDSNTGRDSKELTIF